MSRIKTFKTYAEANMMEVEAILWEVYAERCRGREEFAMFDGGAHKAYHTIRMLDLPRCRRVHAVEADPFMVETLREKLNEIRPESLDRVVVHHMALQDNPERTQIPWRSSSSHVGRSSIVAKDSTRQTIWEDAKDIVYRDEQSVPATTIDRILDTEELPVPFVKLDLEGADLLALTGAPRTLRERRPVVAFENSVHAPKVHGFSIEDIAGYFASLGYIPMNAVGEAIGPENWFGFFEAWAAPEEDVEWVRLALDRALLKRGL